jgi:hypothetical protein
VELAFTAVRINLAESAEDVVKCIDENDFLSHHLDLLRVMSLGGEGCLGIG